MRDEAVRSESAVPASALLKKALRNTAPSLPGKRRKISSRDGQRRQADVPPVRRQLRRPKPRISQSPRSVAWPRNLSGALSTVSKPPSHGVPEEQDVKKHTLQCQCCCEVTSRSTQRLGLLLVGTSGLFPIV